MQVEFIFVLCVLAVVNAGYSSHHIDQYHIPVIKNGVPIETPEVQAAKAAHFAAHALASERAKNSQDSVIYIKPESYHGDIYQDYDKGYYDNYQTNAIDGYSGSNGLYESNQYNYVPVDTPEVQHAKAQHFAAVAAAKSRHRRELPYAYGGGDIGGYSIPTSSYAGDHVSYTLHHDDHQHYHGPIHIPIITKYGVPLDTPEVQHARQQHLAAHASAKYGLVHQSGNYAADYSHYVPHIGPDGVPFDTPEVQLAKAQHFAAHAKESAKHAHW